jgi:hypothetical protein
MKTMKRKIPFLLVLTTVFLAFFCLTFDIGKSEPNESYPDIQLNRTINIEEGGAIVINDTVIFSSNISQAVTPFSDFQIGFPVQYKEYLTHFFSFDYNGELQATITGDSNDTEFNWININFPDPINVSYGASYNFTLTYVFWGLINSEGGTSFRFNYSLYPSLFWEAKECNVTIRLPKNANTTSFSPQFSIETFNSHQILNNQRVPLEKLANVSATIKFTAQEFSLLEINELKREAKIDGWNHIRISDYYLITNKGDPINKVYFLIPNETREVSVHDIYGEFGSSVTLNNEGENVEVEVSLRETLFENGVLRLLVTQSGWQNHLFNISLVRPQNWVIKTLSVIVNLPEGAEYQNASKHPQNINKEFLTETIFFLENNVTKFQEFSLTLEYNYLVLWVTFRPILLIGTVVAISGVVFFLKRGTKITTIPKKTSSQVLKKFVELYEEKIKTRQGLESLEKQVRRGKISRRNYKLRKRSIDLNLSKLKKELTEIIKKKEMMERKYAEKIKQIEIAETEIETMNKDIIRVNIRYQRRELSTEAHKRLVEKYRRIKEQAENTIAETLLRLREDLH